VGGQLDSHDLQGSWKAFVLDLCQVEPNSRLPLPGAKLDLAAAGWLPRTAYSMLFMRASEFNIVSLFLLEELRTWKAKDEQFQFLFG